MAVVPFVVGQGPKGRRTSETSHQLQQHELGLVSFLLFWSPIPCTVELFPIPSFDPDSTQSGQ